MGKKKKNKNKNHHKNSHPQNKPDAKKLNGTPLCSEETVENAKLAEISKETAKEIAKETNTENAENVKQTTAEETVEFSKESKKTKNETSVYETKTEIHSETNSDSAISEPEAVKDGKKTAVKSKKDTAKTKKAEKSSAKKEPKAKNTAEKESKTINKAPEKAIKKEEPEKIGFFKNIFAKYKAWLYREPEQKKDTGAPPHAAVALILPLIIFIFGLYYIGLFDIAFIPRPESWETNMERFFSIGKTTETKDPVLPEESLPEEDVETENLTPDKVPSVDLKDTLNKDRDDQKINNYTVFRTDDELFAEGYYITDGTYDSYTCEVGLLTFDFELPRRFTYRDMLVRDWVITEYDDGRMSTVEETETTRERPALYPYMGYIIYDDANRGLYLLDYNGKVLMNYNENYIPAFARTKDGDPLFYTTYRYYAETPVSVEKNEAGEEVVTDAKAVYLTGKNYFTLSASGTSFVKVDYVEERDGRGLNFDFEDSFGLSDSKIKRVGVMSPKFTTFLDGKSALVNFMNWNYFLEDDPNIPWLEDIVAKETEYNALPIEEKLKLIEEKQTPADLYALDEKLPYSAAFNYSEKYAVVMTDDTGEEPKYETKELRVINTYGEMQFVSKKGYYNTELKDYCSDRFLLPLSKGEDSIGHLYFDHGLLRLRKVTFDQFQLDEFGVLRVNMDRDVLVYPNGREFPIPDGYTLKGYSDGVMVLERGGLYGYMDYTGRWIAHPEYDMATPFYSGVGVVTKNGHCAALDVNGNYVLPFRYTYISNRSDGIMTAYSETKGWEVYGIFTK